MVLLKKILVCLELYYPQIYHKAQKQTQINHKNYGKNSNYTAKVLQQLLNSNQLLNDGINNEMKINPSILLTLLFYLENLFSIDQSFEFTKQELIQLLQYSDLPLPFPETNNSSLATPSIKTLSLILHYHHLCLTQIQGYYQDGFNNIWIIKSNHSSRGRHITLINNLHDIENLNNGMKIIQKYIENIWTLRSITEKQKLKYPTINRIIGKKFDIRLWVLVKSYHPLDIWIYQNGYLRISNQSYQLQALNEKTCHLTNYSINKTKSNINPQETYVLLQHFLNFLQKQQNHNRDKLMTNIKSIILETFKHIDFQTDHHKSFQLFGFDIILDGQLNPWILQCNMSPACTPRGQLKSILEEMTQGMLTIMGFIEGNIKNWCQLANQKNNRFIKKQVNSQKTIRQIKIDGNIHRNHNFMKLNTTRISWNEISIQGKKFGWKKYQKLQSIHYFIQKVIFIQNFFRKRKNDGFFQKKNAEKSLNYRSLKLIQILTKVIKKQKKLWLSHIHTVSSSKKYRRR